MSVVAAVSTFLIALLTAGWVLRKHIAILASFTIVGVVGFVVWQTGSSKQDLTHLMPSSPTVYPEQSTQAPVVVDPIISYENFLATLTPGICLEVTPEIWPSDVNGNVPQAYLIANCESDQAVYRIDSVGSGSSCENSMLFYQFSATQDGVVCARTVIRTGYCFEGSYQSEDLSSIAVSFDERIDCGSVPPSGIVTRVLNVVSNGPPCEPVREQDSSGTTPYFGGFLEEWGVSVCLVGT
jgi:hypothetical protein